MSNILGCFLGLFMLIVINRSKLLYPFNPRFLVALQKVLQMLLVLDRRVTRGGRVLHCSLSKFKESALILGKNALTRFIYGYNFSFKMLF